jgi:hypothetical protein
MVVDDSYRRDSYPLLTGTARRRHSERCASSTRPDRSSPKTFDRTEGTPWRDKLFRRERTDGGAPVTVWGM